MINDEHGEPNHEYNSDLPENSSIAGEEAGGSLPLKESDRAEDIRLAHEKESHTREGDLFSYAKWTILGLFIFAGLFASGVVIAVAFGSSPWLITLASISILTPAVLLACLFQHVYSKNHMETRIINQIIDRAPIMELVKNISDWLQDLIKSKK